MVTFLIVFFALVGLNALLLFLSNSLVYRSGKFNLSLDLFFGNPDSGTARSPKIYPLNTSDSELRNAV